MSAARHGVFHRLRVSEVEPLTDDSVCVTFEVPPELADAYAFTQGQHVTLRAPQAGDDERRTYSLCVPAGSGRLRIGVKVLPGGTFSRYAAERLAVGDELDVMTPAGSFHTPLDPARRRHHAAIAAGSGITPILSIAATTLQVEPLSSFTLVYANRTSRSVMFLEELEDLKDRHGSRFQLIHVLSREEQDAELLSGRLDAARLTKICETLVPAETVDEWFLCGPFALVSGAREALLALGVDPRHVHTELFHVESTPPPRPPSVADEGDGALVELTLDGRRSRLRLRGADVPILEAVLRERSDAPYACRGGVCGTCRARLVSGTVAMDANYALEPDEVEAGYVLTCQSHPTSEHVVLDYDA